jgi:hypothetical protein
MERVEIQKQVMKLAESIYEQLSAENLDVALDALSIAKILTRERLTSYCIPCETPQAPAVSA